jgi:histidine phosphotransferase ChpT
MAGRRLDLNWHGPASLPRRQAQVVVLGLLCLDKALPQGGAIGVSEANGAWILTATAPVVKTDPDLWETLYTFDREVTDPAYVQFLLMPYYLDRLNRSCTVDIKEDSVTLTL